MSKLLLVSFGATPYAVAGKKASRPELNADALRHYHGVILG